MDPLTLASGPLRLEAAMTVAAMAVGLVFGYAAVAKLADVPGLIAALHTYKFVPGRLAPLSAGLLIAGEGLIALAHLTGIGLRLVVPGTLVLLSTFVVVLATLIKRGDKRPCLCFGANRDEPTDHTSLVRISILWLTEGLLYLALTMNDVQTDSRTVGIVNSIESFLLAALIVTLAGWTVTLPRLGRVWQLIRSW